MNSLLNRNVRNPPFTMWALMAANIRLKILALRLQRIALFCQGRYFVFKYAYFSLKHRHLLFQQINMVSEDGGRSVLFDPFFDCIEWFHVILYLLLLQIGYPPALGSTSYLFLLAETAFWMPETGAFSSFGDSGGSAVG